MISIREAKIDKRQGIVKVETFPKFPKLEQTAFLLILFLWMAFMGFALVSLLGFVSRETMGTETKVILTVFLALWISVGGKFMKDEFFRSFARRYFIADQSGITAKQVSPFGESFSSYSWKEINHFSEYVRDDKTLGGLVVVCNGKSVTLDSRLPNETTKKIVKAFDATYPG